MVTRLARGYTVNDQQISLPGSPSKKAFSATPTEADGKEKRKLQNELENLPTLSSVLKKCKGDELGKLVDVKLYPSE